MNISRPSDKIMFHYAGLWRVDHSCTSRKKKLFLKEYFEVLLKFTQFTRRNENTNQLSYFASIENYPTNHTGWWFWYLSFGVSLWKFSRKLSWKSTSKGGFHWPASRWIILHDLISFCNNFNIKVLENFDSNQDHQSKISIVNNYFH